MEEVLINISPRETRVATLVDGALDQLHIERKANRGIVGNVYLGRVVRVLPGMQSAFVDVGLERTAFLHVLDVESSLDENGNVGPIERYLTEGQTLMVQVSKDPIGTKGARLTTTVSLAGHKLVYLPNDTHIGVSQRIEDEGRREALRMQLTALRPEAEKGGYIIRTCAEESASDQEFLDDMAYLKKLWGEISDKALHSKVPALLYEDLSLSQRVLRDFVSADTKAVRVDNTEVFAALKAFAERFVPNGVTMLEHYVSDRPLFDTYGIEAEIDKALSRRVDLKLGGYLVIDQTEAMTTIDVNTGAYVGKRDFSETVFRTNLEAAQMIARQLRLRNLGGIVIVDFIDMESKEHQEAVLAELRRAVASDHTKITVSEFTELGLVEMTRKRTRESLSHVLCENCPVCGGRGQIKTSRTVCYDIMREIVRMSRLYKDARTFKILSSETVVAMFLEDESAALDLLQEAIGREVTLSVDPAYNPEEFDIVIL